MSCPRFLSLLASLRPCRMHFHLYHRSIACVYGYQIFVSPPSFLPPFFLSPEANTTISTTWPYFLFLLIVSLSHKDTYDIHSPPLPTYHTRKRETSACFLFSLFDASSFNKTKCSSLHVNNPQRSHHQRTSCM